jgi:ATP-binding protein involved in chromosome partitioning
MPGAGTGILAGHTVSWKEVAMPEQEVTEEVVREALKNVKYPGFSRDILSFGIVKGVKVNPDPRAPEPGRPAGVLVSARFELTSDKPEVMDQIKAEAEKVVAAIPGVGRVLIETKVTPPAPVPGMPGAGGPAQPAKNIIPGVRHAVAVASGKGGVGKSTVAVNLAVALAREGWKVGLLDADIYGPSVPLMMGVVGAVPTPGPTGVKPIESHGVRMMSIGFFVDKDAALIWRGPMVMKALTQLLEDVEWGELDYLVVDLPPGTGDAQLTLSQAIRLAGAVIVTTPQDVALLDAVKGVTMFRKVEVPILGIVENMSFFICPHCNTESDIFSHGGAAREATRLGVPFLGEVPIHPTIRSGGDDGVPVVAAHPDAPQSKAFSAIAKSVISALDGPDARPGGNKGILGRLRAGFGLS